MTRSAAIVNPDNMVTSPVTPSCAVSIRGIARAFNGVTVLNAVNLDIRKGEFFSLLGPSGCGKTTLLRIIAGFETPNAGDLRINGTDVTGIPAHARRTNMVFQHGALFPHLTVSENVAFGLEMKRMPAKEVRRRVEDNLALVRLSGFGARRVDELSGGQRQRVALARALVNEPDVLLLDEPLSALDLQLRIHMQEELRRIQRETKATFVFVTHDQGEAITMSDRLAVMQNGEILQVGTPREVYERPARRFVAEFMGRSNLLRGTVKTISARHATVVCQGIEISGLMRQQVAPNDEVVVALRYEKIELSRTEEQCGSSVATVAEETYMGASVRRRLVTEHGVSLISETSNTSAPGLGVGARVTFGWDSDSPSVLGV
jgi:spermidine/putrescine ABC transporter ATP-binding subunit